VSTGFARQMQHWPLTCDKILAHAAAVYPDRAIVTRGIDGMLRRTDYASLSKEAFRVAQGLMALGVKAGDRVATLAWNTDRHLAVWYGTMAIGAVYHTLNPRLHPDQLSWIANHAGDVVLVADTSFSELAVSLAASVTSIRRVIYLTMWQMNLPILSLAIPIFWRSDTSSSFPPLCLMKMQRAAYAIHLARQGTRRAYSTAIAPTFFMR
jgi:acyl-CoA synthetase (AMP-forming)/AMP-acid ligase II